MLIEIISKPCNLIGLQYNDLFPYSTCFASNGIFSIENRKQQIRFQSVYKVTNHITGNERQRSYHVSNFATFVLKTLSVFETLN